MATRRQRLPALLKNSASMGLRKVLLAADSNRGAAETVSAQSPAAIASALGRLPQVELTWDRPKTVEYILRTSRF
ncbi:MAG: hypothetical protein ACFB12_01390 [Leptolyngbyaceae cyanobacterium]